MALDDLAGARIDDRSTVGPSPRLAVHPLDDVVADVERMGVLGQEFNPEGVFIAGRLEGLGPPVRALDQRVTDERRRAPVEIVDDRFDHGAAFGGRVDPFQPVPDRVGTPHRRVERGRHVVEIQRDCAGAVVGLADFIAGFGQGHEGVVYRQRHRSGVRRDGADLRPRLAAGQGQQGVDFHVFRKGQCGLGERRAALGIDGETALVGIGQPGGHADRITGEKAGQIDQDAISLLGNDVGAPDHRAGEGLPGSPCLVLAGTDGPVAAILELGEDAVIDPEETQDL